MTRTKANCAYCNRGFLATHYGGTRGIQQTCSKSCGVKMRFKQHPETFKKTNGNGNGKHMEVSDALKLIRVLHNAGFLTRETIKDALRRSIDETPITA